MSKVYISLKEAKHQFSILLDSITESDKADFISSIYKEQICNETINDYLDDSNNFENKGEGFLDDPIATLNMIANDVKKRVPLDAILSSENIRSPTIGENADCLPHLTVHVDEFLYDEEDVEELVEEGKLKRNYCKDCGSKNIDSLIFTSHSMSRADLFFIFNNSLPTLENKVVLDIGSRLGSVLYGAYVFTDASRIIGVEMNEDLCKLQKDIVSKYNMEDRIEVLHKRIEEAEDIVQLADVIIINNPFEFYVSENEHIQIWQFLRRHIKRETILITCPHLETIFKSLNTQIHLSNWVKPYNLGWNEANMFYNKTNTEDTSFNDIAFYEII
ncbi:PREDICTED: uncharacterized protein LOC105367779 [Ceratosolen solmsi marchali]|uniref:Uncharacterized protein LOC105367779 n=1 Tax=Ceratosolen solmsi marchali TaxID=326594 RepID=A0AAJ7E1Y8_9HYME|nr:PREDICTED: uncharacterized protein LOC105367779 [Ceratosolen solmsi marchali]